MFHAGDKIATPKNNIIKAFRIDDALKKSMDESINKINDSGYIEVNQASFLRQAIAFYCNNLKTMDVGFSFKDKK